MISIFAIVLCTVLVLTSAHYNLIDPKPYNPIDCNRPDCLGPCPPLYVGQSRKNVAEYKRGQWIQFKWGRNNHEGGFYRVSLVPVRFMNVKWMHKRNAFDWGCWESNRWFCGRNKPYTCGTDKNGFAYRNWIQIPTVFPDGDYIFAMTWFGGLSVDRMRAFFSDYYTCSFVRIKGGKKSDYWTPHFRRGKTHKNDVKPGLCKSASRFQGECGGEECKFNKVYDSKPREFMNGRKPKSLRWKDMAKVAAWGGKVQWRSRTRWQKAKQIERKEKARDDAMSKGGKKKSKKKGWWAGKWHCGVGKRPKKPFGSWGPRYKKLWYTKRAQHHRYWSYCNACKDC